MTIAKPYKKLVNGDTCVTCADDVHSNQLHQRKNLTPSPSYFCNVHSLIINRMKLVITTV